MWTTGPFKKGKEYFFVFRKHFLSYSLRRPDKERVKKRVGHPSYLHSTVRTDVLMGPKWTKSIRCGHGIPSGMAQRLQFSVLLEFCMVSLITVFLSFRILYGFSHYGPWQAHAPLSTHEWLNLFLFFVPMKKIFSSTQGRRVLGILILDDYCSPALII